MKIVLLCKIIENLVFLFFEKRNLFSAKMDATENDVPSQYEVRGFPTIYFAPKNDKNNPKKYEVRILFFDLNF
jgi:protein disulfide isomerase family A protein 3